MYETYRLTQKELDGNEMLNNKWNINLISCCQMAYNYIQFMRHLAAPNTFAKLGAHINK